jgi:gliding motility-associated protein GldL
MSFSEFVRSEKYQNVMKFVYGWGATVVLIGALFKINHWPGATIMLIVGLGTEGFIFFMSAFEPLHKEWDWSLVYPELAGEEGIEHGEEKRGHASSAVERFDEMLNEAGITPEVFERLSEGLQKLNETTSKLADISDVTVATNNYVENFEKASETVKEFSEKYASSSEKLNQAAEELSQAYVSSSQNVTSSASKVADAYETLVNSLNEEIEVNKKSNQVYSENLAELNKNLEALNKVYEMQLQKSNEFVENTSKVYDDLEEITDNLKSTVEDTKRYKEEISKLNENLAALNTIYGNMLSAMSVRNQ